ncbi:MAG: glycosyltransferase [Betaproteobacteria bacterium]|nr:glycosyltransferase [Betaproteobacteria bacterium]
MLSIVIPALDEAQHLAERLASLAPFRARGCEIVLVDGGSRDATVEIARDHCDRVLRAPAGRASQMNAGAHAARGETLLFLHADTVLPDAADRLVTDALATGRHVWGRFDVRIAGRSRWFVVIAAMMNARSRLTGVATGDQAIFCTREAFRRAGGYPDIALMEDVAFSKRMRGFSRPACLPARVRTSGRRWERDGVWHTILLMWRLRLAYFLGVDPGALARQYRSHRGGD